MSMTNLGDLSQSFSMRQQNIALREQVDRYSTELATGQVADVRSVLNGNYSTLADFERRSTVIEAYSVATTEATLFTDATQDALGNISEFGADLSASLLIAGTSAIGISGSDTVLEARNALSGIIGAINSNTAGRYLFSGNATDQPPLADTDAVLTALRSAAVGATSPDDVLAAAQTWFDDPAGFEATLYQGSSTKIASFALSPTDRVAMDVRAVDPRLKDVIKLTAVAALATDPAFGFTIDEQSELFGKAGQALLVSQDDMISLRTTVGFAQARIDSIATRNSAELTSLEFAITGLLEADPFEAATKLEEAQFQLQSLYSVTVRNSQLSLVNFL